MKIILGTLSADEDVGGGYNLRLDGNLLEGFGMYFHDEYKRIIYGFQTPASGTLTVTYIMPNPPSREVTFTANLFYLY